MDLIVAACRTLASRPRLRLLRAIHEQPGRTVQVLAVSLALPVDAASKHLKLLRNLHLIRATPSGRYVRCAPPGEEDTSNRFLRELQRLLKELFGGRSCHFTLAQVWSDSVRSEAGWEAVYGALEKHFTAYTHLRRLLILRELAIRGACQTEDLARTIGMSPVALGRHLDKLRRRGVITVTEEGAGVWKIVRDARQPCRQTLLVIVLRALQAT